MGGQGWDRRGGGVGRRGWDRDRREVSGSR